MKKMKIAGLAVLAIAAGFSAGAPAAQASVTAPSAVTVHDGLVRFQSGGCLTAVSGNFGAPVTVASCHSGQRDEVWAVRSAGGRVMICRPQFLALCGATLNHIGDAAVLRSVYASGAWIVYHRYGSWYELVEGSLKLTTDGDGRKAAWQSGVTANAGRQIVSLPS